MKKTFLELVRKPLHAIGVDIVRHRDDTPRDFDPRDQETIEKVRQYTMTSPERINALCEATRYIVANGIPGDVVECGVWRGGSMMAVARTLLALGDTSRQLFLFDTFEGMPTPSAHDADVRGVSASAIYREPETFCLATLEEVKRNIATVGYDARRIHFKKGKVEDTIPAQAPERIALLRLDTDWYESTRHELEHLYDRLEVGGVLVIDDYGHWKGARKAVDEFIAKRRVRILLNRIDYTGRIAVKTDP